MRKYVILLLTTSVFFIMATSTSEDLVDLEYECQVQYENNSIILISESNIDIFEAGLVLSLDPQSVNVSDYSISDYSLDGLAIDTIPVNQFLSAADNSTYPLGREPYRFSMSFNSQDTLYSKLHMF